MAGTGIGVNVGRGVGIGARVGTGVGVRVGTGVGVRVAAVSLMVNGVTLTCAAPPGVAVKQTPLTIYLVPATFASLS